MECSSVITCEGGTRLLLQALNSGPQGTLAAVRVSQNFPGPYLWKSLTETLCMKVPTSDMTDGKLTLKPALLLLPLQTQRNLLSFLQCMTSQVPPLCARQLADAVSAQECSSDGWLGTLSRLLITNSEIQTPPSSPWVMEKIKFICSELYQTENEHHKLGWLRQPCATMSLKRKELCESEDLEKEEDGPDMKRVCSKGLNIDSQSLDTCVEEQEVKASDKDGMSQELPKNIKLCIPRLRELLHEDMESESWGDAVQENLKELCESCNPEQLQSLLSSLETAQLSPESFLQLCCQLHSLSPDLSYSHSLAVASSLFKEQALSLTSPAPRPLIAALSMFCMKYARSACNTLIGPLLLQAETGSVYTDFLCRMVSECLQPEQLCLCFGPVLEVPLCEGSLSVLHTLLERQVVMSHSEFEHLLLSLCTSAENFSKSMIFSKLLLTIMSRNQSLVLPIHIAPLTNALNSNQTFLKKSLQAALKKVQENIL
ncbi:Fanconi anemia group E protein [Rhinophrynus dorsalis]